MSVLTYPFFCLGVTMLFKKEYLRVEFKNAPVALQTIVCDADQFSRETFGKPIVITRILEKITGSESGVHQQYRAVDLRDEYNGVFRYTDSQASLFKNWLNEKYKRLDGFKVCLHHGAPKHLHVQIPAQSADLRSSSYKK